MASTPKPAASDSDLIQIVDDALTLAAEKSGAWLVCKPGCTQCCTGVFPISQLDAVRLRRGLVELQHRDPERAGQLRQRVAASAYRLSVNYPGSIKTGILGEAEEDQHSFESFGNDEVCPVLDPVTGACDLYRARPMTCRVFGPPVRSEDGLGVCELCYHGATEEEIASCEMVPDPCDLEGSLLLELESKSGVSGQTIVAFALNLSTTDT